MTSPPDRILVVGMMGAGKTTVGRALAERLDWPFLDNDGLVRGLTGREPAEIDATDGEDVLHDAEVEALRAAVARPGPAVIAVAGAVIDRPEERQRLRGAGHVVWLRAEATILRERIGSGAGRRDDATNLAWLTARAVEREPAYRAVADQVIDVGVVPVEETVDRIVQAVGAVARNGAGSAG
jgi:shikimate kinase